MSQVTFTILNKQGVQCFKDKDYHGAIKNFSDAIKLADSVQPACLLNLASAKLQVGQFDSAVNDCDQVLQISAESEKAYAKKGLALLGLKKYEEAKTIFQKGLSLGGIHQFQDIKQTMQNGLQECIEAIKKLDAQKKEENEKARAEQSAKILAAFKFACMHFPFRECSADNIHDYNESSSSVQKGIRRLSSYKIITFLRHLGSSNPALKLSCLPISQVDEQGTFLLLNPDTLVQANSDPQKFMVEANQEQTIIRKELRACFLEIHDDKIQHLDGPVREKAQLLSRALNELKLELDHRFQIVLTSADYLQEAERRGAEYSKLSDVSVNDKNSKKLDEFWDAVEEFDCLTKKECKQFSLETMQRCLKTFRKYQFPHRALFVRIFMDKCTSYVEMDYSRDITVRIVCMGRDVFEQDFDPATTILSILNRYYIMMNIDKKQNSIELQRNGDKIQPLSMTIGEIQSARICVFVAKECINLSQDSCSTGKRKPETGSENFGPGFKNRRGYSTCPYCQQEYHIRLISDHKKSCRGNSYTAKNEEYGEQSSKREQKKPM